MSTKITFDTIDRVKIVADWYPAPTTLGVTILLHMMPNNRRSWAPFAFVLNQHNIAALAIDLRGHGESIETVDGAKLDYRKFTDEQHRNSLFDVLGAIKWLGAKGYKIDDIMLVGASIGSAIALLALEDTPGLAGAVLLSPGNYRGVDIEEQANHIKYHHSIWTTGSDIDDPEAYESAKKIVELAPAHRKKFVPYENAGHGIHLFTSDPNLMDNIALWIKESFQQIIE